MYAVLKHLLRNQENLVVKTNHFRKMQPLRKKYAVLLCKVFYITLSSSFLCLHQKVKIRILNQNKLFIKFLSSNTIPCQSMIATNCAAVSLKERLVARFLCPVRPLYSSVHSHEQLRESCEEILARFVNDLSCLGCP